jgi:hypothetical protein
MPDAVEEFEDLDRPLATETNSVTILCSLNGTVFLGQCRNQGREFIDALAVVEQIVDYLVYASLRDLLTQHLAHAVLRLMDRGCEITDPRRVEASSRYERLKLSRQCFFAVRQGYRVPRQI